MNQILVLPTPATRSVAKPTTYLTVLTPLRGLAALLVLVYHSSLFLLPLEGSTHTQFISKGFLWVDFFFVLSGFVITYAYGSYFEKGVQLNSYKKYVRARFARIYPLHVFTLLVAVLLGTYIKAVADPLFPLFQPLFEGKAIPTSLLLIQALHLHPTPPLNTPSWSLSTEWWVYLLFPLLVRPFFKMKRNGKAGLLLGIAGLYAALMYGVAPRYGNLHFGAGRATIDLAADFGLFRCLAGFLLGMLFYQAYQNQWGYQFFKKDAAFGLLVVLVLSAMHYGVNELLIIALFPLIILAGCYNTGRLQQLLATRPWQRLGDWSFSLYMVHIPLLYILWAGLLTHNPKALADFAHYGASLQAVAPAFLPGWSLCVVWVTASLLVASLTHRYLEKPARAYLNNRV